MSKFLTPIKPVEIVTPRSIRETDSVPMSNSSATVSCGSPLDVLLRAMERPPFS